MPIFTTLVPMIAVNVKDATLKLRKAMEGLSREETAKAAARAINHSLAKGKTAASKNIRDTYRISAADVSADTQIQRATPQNVTGYIKANKQTLSLSKFNPVYQRGNVITKNVGGKKGGFASNKTRRKGTGVTVEIIKGQKVRLPSAFLMLFKSGKGSVFARGEYGSDGFQFGKERLPITKLNTKSVYWAMLNEGVSAKTGAELGPMYQERLHHELTKGLKYSK
jgi:hypothetical protein